MEVAMAKKRQKFECWNCGKKYSLLREVHRAQKLYVACPFCHEEGVVDLLPHRKPKPVEVFRGAGEDPELFNLDLPEVLPTEKYGEGGT